MSKRSFGGSAFPSWSLGTRACGGQVGATNVAITLATIPQSFQLPRPDWWAVRQWVETSVPPDQQVGVWGELADDWLRVLRDALGSGYRIDRSEHLLLLSPFSESDAGSFLRFAEYGLAGIVQALGDLACEEWLGPLVILQFADDATYGRYASPWAAEMELIRSTGQCVRDGYVHIALRPQVLSEIHRTLLHELTHATLSHVNLPLWLEEGVTQLAEEAAAPQWGRFELRAEEAAEIRAYWRKHGLSEFWFGSGFHRYDEGQTCSYRLADILFRLIGADHRRELSDFVRHAHPDDAGDSAARKYLGKSVAEIAAGFLGTGDWDAIPPDAEGYRRRGVLLASREEHAAAIRDFDAAIALDGRMGEAFTQRGWSHHQSGRYAAAIADYERGIELDRGDYVAHNNLAWLLATCPDEAIRNGDRAIEHAQTACERCGYSEWYCLGTLAAASAEAGDFEEAVRWAQASLDQAPPEERGGCEERLRLYESECCYRDEAVGE